MSAEHRDGVPWYYAPKPRRFHRHRAQTKMWDRGRYVEVCACGASRHAPNERWHPALVKDRFF